MSKRFSNSYLIEEDKAQIDSLKKEIRTSSIYSIELKYRAKNGYGGVITTENKFWLDSTPKVFFRLK